MTTLGNIAHNVATKGLRRSATHYWFRIYDIVYERRLGISTGDFSPHSAGVENLDFYRHTPTSYAEFRSLMRRVPIVPDQEVFMDYGSGLGRVLIAAAAYPFRKVIGLELLESFNRTAARNIEKCRSRFRCKDIELITADATEFVPPSEVTTFFFYNPFLEPMLRKVLHNIHTAVKAQPRRIRLIFRHPIVLTKVIEEFPWLHKRAAYLIGDYEYWVLDNLE
jgi:SAM-dependent methyltransferase